MRPAEPPASGPRPARRVDVARHAAIGFAMGCADVVPGVSGGTVALVGGIYTRLVDAIRHIAEAAMTMLRGHAADGWAQVRSSDWRFLVPVLAGIGAAVVSLVSVIEHQLEENPVRVAGLFLGLVAGSIVVVGRMLKRIDSSTVAIVAATAIALFLLLGLRTATEGEAGDAATAPLWAYPLAAAVAICAMILPGISGSLLLVMMGMYADVLAAANDREVLPLLLFVVGAIVGLAAFSRLLARLLHRHRHVMVAVMVGLMLGSVRVLWPWPHGTDTSTLALPRDDVAVPVLLAVAGFVVVTAVGFLGVLREETAPG